MHSFICFLKIEFLDKIINNLKNRIQKSINKLQDFFFTYIVDLAKEAKWFAIMLSESVLQCNNGNESHRGKNKMYESLGEERTKYFSAKNQSQISIFSNGGNPGWRRAVLSDRIFKTL